MGAVLETSNRLGRPVGTQDIKSNMGQQELRFFTKYLLEDVRALEQMIENDLFERDVRRIGAEQELFLVDRTFCPAPTAVEIIQRLADPHFATELAQFNLEFNLDPLEFGGDCLSQMERQIEYLLAKARTAAVESGAEVILVGILPTLTQSDLTLANMTPRDRYRALNRALSKLRGTEYEFVIKGVDELYLKWDSIMVEACNSSFQVHFQVHPAEFSHLYNAAQAITAPVLAASTNAPLLFGRRLWAETRIALFEQSIDTRSATEFMRQAPARVSFGQDWVRESVLEIFREDIARFKVLFGIHQREDPFEALEQGRAPRLDALGLHNGTVYRWNRACYGLTQGRSHLRIEARFLPSGPTPLDEIANAAFWFGLLSGELEQYGDVTKVMKFEQAKANFNAAARQGLNAQFSWIGDKTVPAHQLICDHLLPLAREGLRIRGIVEDDIERYLGVIENRVKTEQTGSTWLVRSLDSLIPHGTPGERLRALTAAAVMRQKEGQPVHEWPFARLDEVGEWTASYLRVEQFMTTDLITVNQHEPIQLVANLMDWKGIRYICVEDDQHRLVGIVSAPALMRFLAWQKLDTAEGEPLPVSHIMQTDPITVSPETRTLEAIDIMQNEHVGCLPVVHQDTLVGLVTESNILQIAKQLIQEKLSE